MRKILVIIDMQNDFITGALGSEEAQKNQSQKFTIDFLISLNCF